MIRIIAIAVFCSIVACGCSWFQTEEDKPAQELAADGMDAMKAGRYGDAIASFEKLKDWYPFSKFAILAELKIADAYYRQGNTTRRSSPTRTSKACTPATRPSRM